ncbi:MAG: MATE family efflux transporter [Bdellovibrionales bacterium]|nr:MATE family efflux transporter [Bdellovibrionales bacterium]
MYKKGKDLTQGPVVLNLLALGGPMLIGMISVIGFALTDTYFIGLLGTQELAAIGYTFPISATVFAAVFGLGVATSSLVSQSIGKRDFAAAKRFTTHCLSLSLLLVSIFIILGIWTITPVFTWLGAQEQTLTLIREYMVLWYAGMLFIVIPVVGNNAIRATGDAIFPAIIMVFAGVLNALMDYVLIFGKWGAPAMGMQGAALASLIARFFTLLASVGILHFREALIDWAHFFTGGIVESWKRILGIASTAAVNNIVIPFSIAIVTRLIASYGEDAVAAFGVASKLEAFALIPMTAAASGMAPFVGQSWGANQKGRILEAYQWMFRFCMLYGAFIGILFYFLSSWMLSWFDQNPEVLRIGTSYLTLVPWSYALEGVLIFSTISFNAIGKPSISLVFTSLRMFIIYIPVALALKYFFGITGIFIACALANLLAGTSSYRYAVYKIRE